ncbi:MAG: hypothetical protein BroJett024_12880 [Alphaproteobacteria bacterium]|nr:MAG: hypothetical protein BroJett024_12880 [Alphaproteobacteria bacterium]
MKSFALKLTFTLAIALIIIWKTDVSAALARFTMLSPLAIVVCLLLALLQLGLLSYRWMLVGRLTALQVPFAELLRCTLASQFFSQGLPASVGGDALRIWWLARRGIPAGTATQNVLLDRLSGFLALLALNLASLPLLVALLANATLTAIVAGTVIVTLAAVILCASRAGRRMSIAAFGLARRVTGKERWGSGLLRWILVLQRAAGKLFRLPHGATVLAWGLLIHLLTVTFAVMIAGGAGIALGFPAALAVVPGVLLLSYLPLSIGGWGVREGGMALGLGLVGIPVSDAVFIGFALGGVGLLAALLGALVWLVSPMPVSATGERR